MNIEVIRIKSAPILKKYGIKSAAIFGSVARGEDGPNSDIDILVEFNKPVGLFKLVHLENELSDKLNMFE